MFFRYIDFFPGGEFCPVISGAVADSGMSLEVTLAGAPTGNEYDKCGVYLRPSSGADSAYQGDLENEDDVLGVGAVTEGEVARAVAVAFDAAGGFLGVSNEIAVLVDSPATQVKEFLEYAVANAAAHLSDFAGGSVEMQGAAGAAVRGHAVYPLVLLDVGGTAPSRATNADCDFYTRIAATIAVSEPAAGTRRTRLQALADDLSAWLDGLCADDTSIAGHVDTTVDKAAIDPDREVGRGVGVAEVEATLRLRRS